MWESRSQGLAESAMIAANDSSAQDPAVPAAERSGSCRGLFAAALLSAACFLGAGAARAQPLESALAQAYVTNPTLEAARVELRRADEQVATAVGAWRPTAGVTAGGGYVNSFSDDSSATNQSQFSSSDGPTVVLQLRARQPIYNFYNGPRLRQAEGAVLAQRARLTAVEQDVLLRAASAYLEMVRAREALRFSNTYETNLQRSVAATQRRFDLGLLRKSALSDAEARQASATADRIRAEGALVLARENYVQVIGDTPDDPVLPGMPAAMPASVEDVLVAAARGPTVAAAEFAEAAARDGVDFSVGQKLPDFYLQGQLDARQGALLALMDMPLYSGTQDPQIRAAKQLVRQRRLESEAQRREARRSALTAWQNLQTAKGALVSVTAQQKSATLAAEGIEREYGLGERTSSDLLDYQLQSFQAQLNLLDAERQLRLAAYQVLAAMGQFTARDLRLDVPKEDVERHYEDVRGQWWGTGIE